MGQRANFVIIKDGNWNLYYDHWIANSIENELFWGPEYSTRFIQQMQLIEDKEDWLDETWCEGGAVIDHDTKTLVWFGGEDIYFDVYLRKTYVSLLENQWQGWVVKWAYGGIEDLGAYVGFDKSKFITKNSVDDDYCFKYDDEYPDDCTFLISVENATGIEVVKVWGDDEALELGEKQLEDVLFFNFSNDADFKESPTGGIHLIQEKNLMYYWTCSANVDLENRVKKAWPNWKCINISDNFEKHFELIGKDFNDIPPNEQNLLSIVFENLERNCHRKQKNVVRELSSRFSGEVEINPWTDCTSQSLGSKEEKLDYLNKLKKKYLK